VPGGIGTTPAKAKYQNMVNGQWSLGHKSAQGLGMVMRMAGKLKGMDLSPLLEALPVTPQAEKAHLDARARMRCSWRGLWKVNEKARGRSLKGSPLQR